MSIFTRFRDIIHSNINAMLDKAEDPEKLIRLMIHEMEDTLIEIKSSCAGAMAGRKKIQRQLEGVQTQIDYWAAKAPLAVDKGREDLAREALMEKRKYTIRAEALEKELLEHDALIEQYQDDIHQLEDKLNSAREKQRMLIQRHIHATRKMRAQQDIHKMDSADAFLKFDELENRIERMEAEAELVNFGGKTPLMEQIENLSTDDEIERELLALKASRISKEEIHEKV